MTMRLEDLFEDYPDVDDPEIQSKLAAKYELAECTSGRKDEKLSGDTFFKQQRLYQRIGYVYDRLAFLAEAGVGKSLGQVCLAEYLKTHDLSNKRCYFITGSSQLDDYKRQLIANEDSPYFTQASEKQSKGMGKVLMTAVKDYYEVKSYGVFLGEIKRMIAGLTPQKANELLIEKFSGSYFFFDEIQFMKITPAQTRSSLTGKIRRRHENYWLLWRLCHLVQRSRITVASARPLTNTVEEFGYAMNLILPNYNQIPVDVEFAEDFINDMEMEFQFGEEIDWQIDKMLKEYAMEEVSDYYLEKFQSYLNGRVIFVASSSTGIELSYLPLKQPTASKKDQERIAEMRESQKARTGEYAAVTSQLRLLTFAVKKDGTLDLQGETYQKYASEEHKTAEAGLQERIYREILTFVFPHGKDVTQNWGTKAEKYWIKKTKDGEYVYRNSAKPAVKGRGLRWYLKNSLESCSVKMWYVRHQAIHYPGKGYSFFNIVHGGGIEIFALALEEGESVRLSSGYTNESFRRYKPRDHNINYRNIPAGQLDNFMTRSPRYGVITGETQSKVDMFNTLDLYNHPDNIHGDFMKHILISQMGLVGTNLMSVMYINSFFMAHNPSDLYQAIRRAIRATSHIALVKEWEQEHPGKPLKVEVNILACLYPAGVEKQQDTFDSGISIRTFMKNKNTSCVIRAYKNLAMTAWILDERNTLSSIHDWKEECDYMSCELDYASGPPEAVVYEYGNYLLMYAEYEIDKEAQNIIRELKINSSLSLLPYVERQTENREPHRSICFLAAVSIVEDSVRTARYEIKDRYGFRCNVIEKHGVLYLIRKNSAIPQGPFTTYYTQNLIAIEQKNIRELFEEQIARDTEVIFQKVESYEDNFQELSVYLGKRSVAVKAAFLEQLILRYIRDESVPCNIANILDILSLGDDAEGNLVSIKEPTQAIQNAATFKGKNYSIELDENPDIFVYVHNIYVFKEMKAEAGVATRIAQSIGRLRILRTGETAWRDTDPYETIVYRDIFQRSYRKKEDTFSKLDIYGIVESNNPTKFRIKNKLYVTGLETSKAPQGCVCQDIAHKIEIVTLMWAAGMTVSASDVRAKYPYTTIDQKRGLLHNEKRSEGGNELYRYVRLPRVTYTFLPMDGFTYAEDDMVTFFHYFLFTSQSIFSKSVLCAKFAKYLYEQKRIWAPGMNRYQLSDYIVRMQGSALHPLKTAKREAKRKEF